MPDEAHGAPPRAIINGTTITYFHLRGIVEKKVIIIGDIPTVRSTFQFIASGLVIHKRSSERFTVPYSIDATLGSLRSCCKTLLE
jgi:hypothetical protein